MAVPAAQLGVEAGEPRGRPDRDPDDRRERRERRARRPPRQRRRARRPSANGVRAPDCTAWERASLCYCRLVVRRWRTARLMCASSGQLICAGWRPRAHSARRASLTCRARGPEGPVLFALTPDSTHAASHATQVSARQDPQHRDHGAHRRRQDDDDRAHPLLHRSHLQDRRGPRGRRDDGLDGAGAGARHHDHVRRDHLRVDATTASTSSTRPATSTSPSRSSARCASSTARSRCSTRSPASSRSPRRSGARPTSTTSRASRSSTRWTASARTSTRPSRR